MKLTTLLKALLCLFISSNLYAQVTVSDFTNYTSPIKKWDICREDTFTVNITVPPSFTAGDSLWLTISLPAGLEGGTVQSLAPLSAGTIYAYGTGTTTPAYTILPVTNSFSFKFSVKTSCQAFNLSTLPAFSLSLQHYSSGIPVSGSTLSLPSVFMPLAGGQMNLSQVINANYGLAQLSVPFPRKFVYENTGNQPFTGIFTFTDTIQYPLTIAAVRFTGIDATILNSGSSVISINQNNDSIVSITLNIVNLAPDDSIVITDSLELLSCPGSSLANTLTWYTAEYGCSTGPQCQVLHIPTVSYTTAAFDPNDAPEMTFLNRNPTIFCPANPDYRKYVFINDAPGGTAVGNASGMDFLIEKSIYTNQISYIDTSTIVLYKYVSGIPVIIPHTFTSNSATPDLSSVTAPNPKHILFKIDEVIAHGDSVVLEFTEKKLCIDSADYNIFFNNPVYMDYITVYAEFAHPCNPTGYYFRDLSRTVWGEPQQVFSLGQFFNNTTGTLTDLEEVWMDVNSTSRLKMNENHPYFQHEVYVDTNTLELEVELQLDSGLCLVADSIFLKGLNVNAPDLYPISVVVTPGDMVNLCTKDNVKARFRIPGTYFLPNPATVNGHYYYGAMLQYSALYDSLFNNFAVSFKVQAKCQYSPPGGFSGIRENFFLVYDNTCAPECKLPLASVGDKININCPGCYLPGWNLSQFKVKRGNLGTADDNNNNHPDVVPLASNPPANPNLAHLERVMVNDTLELHIEAFTSDGENLLFSNIGFDYDYGQLSLQGGIMNDLEYISGTGTYTIASTSQNFNIPAGAGAVNPSGQFYIMLDNTDWYSYGLSPAFFTNYDAGHSVKFDFKFRVKNNLNNGSGPDPYFSMEGINGFMYMSGTDFDSISGGGKSDVLNVPQNDIENPALYDSAALAQFLYWCTGWEGRIVTVGADFHNSAQTEDYWGRVGYGPETDPCLKVMEYVAECSTGQTAAGMSDINQNALNAFSFELRNLWQLDSIDFMIPGPYEIERIELRYQVMTPNALGTATTLSCNPIWSYFNYASYPFTNPSDTTWLNDTTVRIYPWKQIQDLTGFGVCDSNMSFFDESKIIRIRPIVKPRDCSTTPMSYPFNNYPITSYWSNFPLSKTNDTVIVKNISGNFHKPFFDWQVDVVSTSNTTPGSTLNWNLEITSGSNANNTPSPSVKNGFLWFGPASGDITITNVQWGSSVTPASVVGSHNGLPIYGLGKVGSGVYNGSYGGSSGPLNVTADYDCSEYHGPDSIMVIYGDNCDGYPDTLIAGNVCYMDTIYIPIPFEEPFLQADTHFPDSVSTCDTSTFRVIFNASGSGSVENITLSILSLPADVQYVPGSGVFYYTSNSTQLDPVGNTFPIDTLSYMHLAFNELSDSAYIDFDFLIGCNYDGSPISFVVNSTNYCGDTLAPTLLTYTPSYVIQTPISDSLQLSALSTDSIHGCRDSGLVSITIHNYGSTLSGTSDTMLLSLPPELVYLSGSPYSLQNGQDYYFSIPAIAPGADHIISFWVNHTPGAGCGFFPIPVNIAGEQYFACDTVNCTTGISLASDTAWIYIEKSLPQFTGIDLTGLCYGDSIVYTVTNNSAVNTGNFSIEIYCLQNGTGPLSPPCLLATSNTYSLSSYNNFQNTLTINTACQDCDSIMAIMVDQGGCFCNLDTLLTGINCDTVYYTDAGFTASADTICYPDTVTFTSVFSGGVHFWDFGDGNTSAAVNPVHVYTTIGTLMVTHIVSNGPVSDTAYQYVTLINCANKYPACCFDKDLWDFNVTCQDTYDPVCGCDQITYINSCVALNFYGISMWVPGPCSGSCAIQADFNYTGTGMSVAFTNTTTGASSYNSVWDFGDAGSSTLNNPVHLYSTPGTYYVSLTVYDAADSTCFSIHCDTIIINACTVPVSAGNDTTVCTGNCITLNSSSPSSSLTYSWLPVTGLSSPNIANPVVCPAANISYTLSVTDTLTGCTGSDIVSITTLPLPDVSTTLNMTVCQNSPLILIGSTNMNTGITSSSWFSPTPSGNVSFNTSNLVVVPLIFPPFLNIQLYYFNPSASGPGTHPITFTATNPANGCTNTATGYITVTPAPVISISGNTALCSGGSTVLTANITSGIAPYSYQWNTGATTASATITSPGTYTVTVTDAYGCTATATANVILQFGGTMSITSSNGTNHACAGQFYMLTATGGYTGYIWYNTSNPSLVIGTSQTFSPSASGTYCVKAISPNGCPTQVACYTVTIYPQPVVTANTPVLNVCQNSPVITLGSHIGPSGLTLGSAYFTPGSGGDIFSSSPGFYSSPVFSILWADRFNPALAGPGTHTIYYSYTNPTTGCSDTASMVINVYSNPMVSISGNTALCSHTTTLLTANPISGTPPYSYSWSTGSVSSSITVGTPGTYTVTITDANGCTGTSSVNVILLPAAPMSITSSTGSGSVCAGQPIALTATGGYTGYIWYNTSNPSLVIGTSQTFSPSASGTYCVKAIGPNGCPTQVACYTVTINPQPVVTANVPVLNVCLNDPAIILGLHIGASGPTYTSYFTPTGGDLFSSSPGFVSAPILFTIWADRFIPSLAGPGAHTIYYSYTDPVTGCSDTASMTINVISGPVISLAPIPPVELCSYNGVPIPLIVSGSGIYCSVSGPGVDSVNYTFDPIAAGGAGSYTITYTCTNKCGTTSVSQTVTVTDGNLWHQTTLNSNAGDRYNDVVTDLQGSVYAVGTFIYETTLDGGNNPDITINSVFTGFEATYLAKYDKCANLLWVAHSSHAKTNTGEALVLDETNGVVYITGNYTSNVRFNSSISSAGLCTSGYNQTLSTGVNQGGYIAQYDMTTGCLYYVEDITFSGNNEIDPAAITINENTGAVYVGGKKGNVGFLISAFIRKYQPTIGSGGSLGTPVWSITSSGGPSVVNDLDFDEQNDRLWSIGSFVRQIILSPGGTRTTNPYNSTTDAFVAAYNDPGVTPVPFVLRKGNILMSAPPLPTPKMTGEGIAIDELTGYVCLTGTFNEAVTDPFEVNTSGGTINSLANNSTSNAYMICIDVPAASGWGRVAEASAYAVTGQSVDIKGGTAYFTGDFNGDVTIDLMPSNPYLFVGGLGILKTRVYAAAYKLSTGNGVWANVTESPTAGGHSPTAITVDGYNNLFIVGRYSGEMSYLSGAPASGNLLSSGSGTNGFILRGQIFTGELRVEQIDEHTLAVEHDDANQFMVKVAPNPTSGLTELTINGLPADAHPTLQIRDLTGHLLLSTIITSTRYQLDLQALASGTYLLTVIYNNQPVSLRVVKID